MTCPSSIKITPTKNAAGTAATSSAASNPMASTAFVDQPVFLAEYQTVMSPTLQQVQSQSRYIVYQAHASAARATLTSSMRTVAATACRGPSVAAPGGPVNGITPGSGRHSSGTISGRQVAQVRGSRRPAGSGAVGSGIGS